MVRRFHVRRYLSVILRILQRSLSFCSFCFNCLCRAVLSTVACRLKRGRLSILVSFVGRPKLLPVSGCEIVRTITRVIVARPSEERRIVS